MGDDAALKAVNVERNNYIDFSVQHFREADKGDVLKACRLALKS